MSKHTARQSKAHSAPSWNSRAKPNRRKALSLESLEERVVLSTIVFQRANYNVPTAFWDDPANWIGGVVPGPNDDAVINGDSAAVRDPGVTFSVHSISGSGGVELEAGTLSVTTSSYISYVGLFGGTLASSAAISADEVGLNDGTITGTGSLEAKSTMDIAADSFGNFYLAGGFTLINDLNGPLVPFSSALYPAKFYFSDGSKIINKPGASMTFAVASFNNNGGSPSGGTVINQGTIRSHGIARSLTGNSVVTFGVPVTNTGTIYAASGTLSFAAGGTFSSTSQFIGGGDNGPGTLTFQGTVNFSGGTSVIAAGTTFTQGGKGGIFSVSGGTVDFSGSGTTSIAAPVTNSGTITIGGTSSPSTVSITGDYTQSSAGSLGIAINGPNAGTGYGVLAVSGKATLAGALNITDPNNYTPGATTTYRPLTFGTRSGDFASKNGLTLGTVTLTPSYDATGLNLATPTIVSPPTVPPVTSTIGGDGTASFSLTASSPSAAASALVFKIKSLPSGTVFANGVPVTLGQTFTGSPVALTYSAPTVIFGNFTDSFGFSVTDPSNLTTTSTVSLSLAAPAPGVAQIYGSSGNDTIVASNSSGNLQVTVNGVTYSVAAVGSVSQIKVAGGNGNDTIELTGLPINATITGGTGTDNLIIDGTTGADTFSLNNTNSVVFNGATITGPAPFTINGLGGGDTYNILTANPTETVNAGGVGNDYVLSDGSSMPASYLGSDTNTLDLSAYSTAVSLNVDASTVTGVVGSYTGVKNVIGSATAGGTLNGPATGSTYNITGANAGNVGGLTFSQFGNIVAGTGSNNFVFSGGATLSGNLTGSGSDTIDLSAYTTVVSANFGASTITGVGGTFSGVSNVIGSGSAGGTLTGPMAASEYNVTGSNAGYFRPKGTTSMTYFSNFGDIFGGANLDFFTFTDGVSISGSLTGYGQSTLDLSHYQTTVAINLSAGTVTGVGGTFSGMTLVIGSSTAGGSVIGPSTGSTYSITGPTEGHVGGVEFVDINNITGGAGDDKFVLGNGVTFPGLLDGGGGSNTLDVTPMTTKVTLNLAASTVTGLSNPFVNIQSFIAGSLPANALYGPTVDSTFNITGTNAGNVGGISFSGFGNLFGGAGNDVFVFGNGAKLTGGLNGGAGVNTIDLSAYTTPTSINLPVSRVTGAGNFSSIQSFIGGSNVSNKVQGPNTANVFNVTATNAGSVAGISFTGFGNLVGGTADDSFIFSAGANLTGGVDGGTGTNSLDLSAYTTQVSVNLPVSRATGAGNFTSIQSFLGGSYYANKVAAPNTSSSFSVAGANVGTVNGLSFSGFGSLVGGTGDDTFVFSAGATLTGGIDGGSGNNTLDLSAYTTATSINMPASRVTGAGNFASIQSFIGGSNFANKVTGPNMSSVFNITGGNAGNVAGVNFSGFGNLVGGAGDDTFLFSAGATLAGGIDGGGGGNTLDLSAYTTATSINMPASRVTGAGNFASIQSFIGGTNIANKVTGVDAGDVFNITGANTGNVDGLDFSGFGNLVGGAGDDSFVFSAGATLTGGLIGGGGGNTVNLSAYTTATSINMPASRVSGLGGTYSGIQSFIGGTNAKNKVQGPNTDSVFNITGANAGNVAGVSFSGFGSLVGGTGNDTFVFSDGASLTGSIDGGTGTNWIDMGADSTNVTINLATGKATGVGGTFSNIQNARGGAGNDTLTGNSAGNILIGGAGNDTIKGGSGRSILIGGTGGDTVIGGSGDDIVIGGSTTFDNDNTALDAILAEWQSSDDFTTRIADIKNGGGLNGTNVLNLVTTVIDDLAANVLTGGTGNDWFFQGTNDTITDQDGGDQVN